MCQLQYSDTPYRPQLRTRRRLPIMTATLSESHRSASWVEIWEKCWGFPHTKFRGPIGKYVTAGFFGQPGAQQLVYIRRRVARQVRPERRVSEIFSVGSPFAPSDLRVGGTDLHHIWCVVYLPSVLDKFVLDFRSSAASRNYGDEWGRNFGEKLGVFAPCKI